MAGKSCDELASLVTKFPQSSCRASMSKRPIWIRPRQTEEGERREKAGNKIERSINCDGKGERIGWTAPPSAA